jgi:hypothetical protein
MNRKEIIEQLNDEITRLQEAVRAPKGQVPRLPNQSSSSHEPDRIDDH